MHLDRRVVTFIFVWPILAVLLGVGVRLYRQRSEIADSQQSISNTTINTSNTELKDQDVVLRLSKHMILPPVPPRIVTLKDIETLKQEQPFFALAKDGFKLIVYPEKVILYDPIRDIIVDFAHIRPGEADTTGGL